MYYKKNKFIYKFLTQLTAGIMAGCLFFSHSITSFATQTPEERVEMQRNLAVQSNQIVNWPSGPIVSAESAILMELETGTILYSKNIHNKEYPASTTKILTSLIAAERCTLDEIVNFSKEAVFDTPSDSSHIAIDVGEALTMEEALGGILVASANEVSFAVAEHIAGSWQDFAPIMNERAKELGCIESNFINPNGLPDDNHYTSSYDLAMIGRAFFANELLCKISSTTFLKIPASERQPDEILHGTKNKILKGQEYSYEHIIGSKTGYTGAARSCLISAAKKDGMTLICVVMKDESPLQFQDTVSLFDYGFSNFDKVNVSDTETKFNIDNADFFYNDNNIFGNSKPILSLNTKDCIVLPKTLTFEDIQSNISYETERENQAALIQYSYENVNLGSVSVDLSTKNTDAYAFDPNPSEDGAQSSNNAPLEKKGPSVIFINVVKVLFGILIAAFVVMVLFFAWIFYKNYQTVQSRRTRRRRNRRRSAASYQTRESSLHQRRREHIKEAKIRRKRMRRPHNKRRDYDF